MPTPTAPVILFDDDHYMYVLRDQAYAEAWWEEPDEFTHGFDALARPLSMTGTPHAVHLTLTGEAPNEPELRRLVAAHYGRHLREQAPPQAAALAEFVAALPREGR
ncbi:hypothetical protein ACPCIU_00975 [Streptomyces seoulensis]|uniref:hypothetical protein n=1 Tax=Streptomyces seoulensis TaxID=73044 RepID=UPI003C2B79AF